MLQGYIFITFFKSKLIFLGWTSKEVCDQSGFQFFEGNTLHIGVIFYLLENLSL